MSEGTRGQWCRMFKEGRTSIQNKERSERSSVVSGDLVQNKDKENCE
jgi:hypothetical protein